MHRPVAGGIQWRFEIVVCAVALASVVACRCDREICIDVCIVVWGRSKTTVPRGHIQGMLFWVLSPTSSTLEEVEMLASVVAWGVAEEPV